MISQFQFPFHSNILFISILSTIILVCCLMIYWLIRFKIHFHKHRPSSKWLWYNGKNNTNNNNNEQHDERRRNWMIVGACGSGKSTLSLELSEIKKAARIDLDQILWLPGWRKRNLDKVKTIIRKQMDQASVDRQPTVIDGNWKATHDVTLQRVGNIIWLDYDLSVVYYRLTMRIVERWWSARLVCNGNRETVWRHFLTTDSLYVWAYRYRYTQVRYEM
jgi:adenylate kinase family enzyme